MDFAISGSIGASFAEISQQGEDVPDANETVLVKVLGTIVRFRGSRKVAAPVV